MIQRYTMLLLMAVMLSEVHAQHTWVRVIGGSKRDQGNSVAPTPDGGCVVTGLSNSVDEDFSGMNHGAADLVAIRFDHKGNVLWKKMIGGSSNERCNNVTTTLDGGMILTGGGWSSDGDFDGMNNGLNDVILVKLSADGNIVWKYTYGGTGRETGNAVIQTADGGIVVTGSTTSNDRFFEGMNKDSSDIFVMKLDVDGRMVWKKTYGGSNRDFGNAVAPTSDGGCVVTGVTHANTKDFRGKSRGAGDVFVVKLDAQGNEEWINTYGGSKMDSGKGIVQTSDGGYAVTGNTHSYGPNLWVNKGDWDTFVIKLDSKGAVEWQKSIGGKRDEDSYAIIAEPDGGVVLTGYTNSNDGDFKGINRGKWDVFAMKLDVNGAEVWKHTYGGSQIEVPNAITRTSDGGFVITGVLNGANPSYDGDFKGMNKGDYDLIVIKIDSMGRLERKKP